MKSNLNFLIRADNEILEKIFCAAIDGLNLEKAKSHWEPLFIIRHLKAGAKLVSFLSSTENSMLKRILEKNVQETLLNLLEEGKMCTAMKLNFLKALDSTLNFGCGLENFIRHSNGFSAYQRLLKFSINQQVIFYYLKSSGSYSRPFLGWWRGGGIRGRGNGIWKTS